MLGEIRVITRSLQDPRQLINNPVSHEIIKSANNVEFKKGDKERHT